MGESQPRQGQPRHGRRWQHAAHRRGIAENNERHRHDASALRRRRSGAGRADGRTSAGDVQPLPESISAIKSGQARALGVTTLERLPSLPDVPTVAETLPGFEAATFQGVGAPTGTSTEIVDKLNKEINAALADATIRQRLGDLGSIPSPGSPAEFRTYIAAETAKWAKVIHAATSGRGEAASIRDPSWRRASASRQRRIHLAEYLDDLRVIEFAPPVNGGDKLCEFDRIALSTPLAECARGSLLGAHERRRGSQRR